MKTLLPGTLYLSLIFLACFGAKGVAETVTVESIAVSPQEIQLNSPFAYNQLVVTAKLPTGEYIDATRTAEIKIQGKLKGIIRSY